MERSDISKNTERHSFDQRRENLYNQFRSHWTGKSIPAQDPRKQVGYKDILAELNCKVRKKRQQLQNRKYVLKSGVKVPTATNSCSSTDFFLTVLQDKRIPSRTSSTTCNNDRIPQIPIEMGIQSQKHQQLKLDSFKLRQQNDLFRRKILELRLQLSNIQPCSDLTPSISKKESAQCLRSAERRYRFINSQQSRLLDMQNRLYFQQHQALMESQENLLKNQAKIETLRERAKALQKELRQETSRHETMVRKIKEYRDNECGSSSDRKLRCYVEIQRFMQRVQGKRKAFIKEAKKDVKICSISQIQQASMNYKQELQYRTSRILSFYKKQVIKGEQLINLYEQRLQVCRNYRAILHNSINSQSSEGAGRLNGAYSSPHYQITNNATQDRRNVSLSTIMAFEQRCLYIFTRCLKLIKVIFSTWNKYDAVLMGKLHSLEELFKVELKTSTIFSRSISKTGKKMVRNKFMGRYLQLQMIQQSLINVVIERKQSRKAKTAEMLWQALVNMNSAACREAIHRVKFSLSKTLQIIRVCRDTRKPIINRSTKRAIRQETQPISIHKLDQESANVTSPPSTLSLKKIIQKLVCKKPLRDAESDLSQKQKQLQLYRLQLFSHRGKSTAVSIRSRRNGKFELLRNYPSTRIGSPAASPRVSINYEVSETWIE